MFKGSITALITPFKDGEIDWKAFETFVDWQISQGTHALVPCGTTGESPTLSHKEHREVIQRCLKVAKGRVPVIAGTGSNSTTEAIELTQYAKEDGADAALIVMPYYNKPTQEGMYQHFKKIHDEVDIPIIIYNIPGRSVVDMSVETMARLVQLPNIVGVKDACGNLARPLLTRLACGKDFCQLSGDDDTVAAFLAQGGVGCISVVSNIAPRLCAQMHEAWMTRNLDLFTRLRDQLAPLAGALFCETSPAPVKYGVSLLGMSTDEVRLPLVKASETARTKVRHTMKTAQLL